MEADLSKPKIVFMGTPDFALPSLQALIDERYPISLVITQPDRPKGRGQKLQPPPVKTLAELYEIPVFQPESLRKDSGPLLQTPCDFLVVIAFGQILPAAILAHPRIAPLNVHASMLPAYRGAAPIARSILEGEQTTGVTIQWMIEALDQGDILVQAPVNIEETDTSASLHDKLSELGASALVQALKLFKENRIVRRSQDARVGSYAAKLQKEESLITFNQPALSVHRAIMGMNPWPVAECSLTGQKLRLFRSRFVARDPHAEPGCVIETTSDEIIVACRQGCVALLEVQQENRKRLPVKEFLKGHPIPTGLILGSAHGSYKDNEY